YSQAIRAGDYLFVSGQIPIDPATGQILPGSVGDQTHRVLRNLGAILRAAGASFDQVVKSTVYLSDMSEFASMNAVYATYFSTSSTPSIFLIDFMTRSRCLTSLISTVMRMDPR